MRTLTVAREATKMTSEISSLESSAAMKMWTADPRSMATARMKTNLWAVTSWGMQSRNFLQPGWEEKGKFGLYAGVVKQGRIIRIIHFDQI